jgi:hypothetical protein
MLTPMTLVQAVIILKNNDIFDSICVGNDCQPDKTYYNKDFTKNLYTSLYNMSVMNLACGL